MPCVPSKEKSKNTNILSSPWRRVAIDIAGLFLQIDPGNKYLMQSCHGSRDADKQGGLVANHGVPLKIHSDQSRDFESDISKQ